MGVVHIPGKPCIENNPDGSVNIHYPVQTLYTFGDVTKINYAAVFKGQKWCSCCDDPREGDEPNEELCWGCYCESIEDYDDDE